MDILFISDEKMYTGYTIIYINTYNNRLIINADITVPARPASRCEA